MFTSRILQQVYKAKRPWPPDFSLLSQKEQFRLERVYRRRSKLKYARPRLQKAVKLAQWGSIVFVSWYCVFWAEWEDKNHMFVPVRNWVKETRDSFWTTQAPRRPEFSNKPNEPGVR